MEEYLLDTQTIIWSEYEPHKISSRCKEILLDPDIVKYISHVSIWEISIKQKVGKLEYHFLWSEYIKLQALEVVKISMQHILATKNLPLIHRDPFDRLLIAQSIIEKMPLITSDKVIHQYDFRFIEA